MALSSIESTIYLLMGSILSAVNTDTKHPPLSLSAAPLTSTPEEMLLEKGHTVKERLYFNIKGEGEER